MSEPIMATAWQIGFDGSAIKREKGGIVATVVPIPEHGLWMWTVKRWGINRDIFFESADVGSEQEAFADADESVAKALADKGEIVFTHTPLEASSYE